MGGQTFTHGGVVLDLRDFNRISLDKQHKTVNVQSGVRWWQLQQFLDKEGLAVKAMQSINIFSVGGTLSVNAHGIDPEPGPIAPTVRSLRVMLSDGNVVKASLSENGELFRHVLGGYGLFGVILDAELDVVDNEMYRAKRSTWTTRSIRNTTRRTSKATARRARLWAFIGGSAVVLEGNRGSILYQDAIRRSSSAAHSCDTRYAQSIHHQFLENRGSGPMAQVDAGEICRAAPSRLCDAQPGNEPEGSMPRVSQRRDVRQHGVSRKPAARHGHPSGVLRSLRSYARIRGRLEGCRAQKSGRI